MLVTGTWICGPDLLMLTQDHRCHFEVLYASIHRSEARHICFSSHRLTIVTINETIRSFAIAVVEPDGTVLDLHEPAAFGEDGMPVALVQSAIMASAGSPPAVPQNAELFVIRSLTHIPDPESKTNIRPDERNLCPCQIPRGRTPSSRGGLPTADVRM